MRLNARGDIASGVGDNQITLWLVDEAAPRPLGRGGAGGWLGNDVFGAGPSLVTASSPSWTLSPFSPYQPNNMYAGGTQWIASRAGAHETLQGTVPPGYEAWKAFDVGPDGTRVIVLNGTYTVFWPNDAVATISGMPQVRACAGAVATINSANVLHVLLQDGTMLQPAQVGGAKWWPYFFDDEWVLYLSATIGGLVCHRIDDATHGYFWPVAPYSPCAVTQPASIGGLTVVAWSMGQGEQAADLRRVAIVLGQGMVPLLPSAIHVPEQVRLGWFGLTDAHPGEPGNCVVGWYNDDPQRPCLESASWLDDAKLEAWPDKCLGIFLSPIEAPEEYAEAVRLAITYQKPILVYCDAPQYLDEVYDVVLNAREAGADAIPMLQAYPDEHETPAESLERIHREYMRLEALDEDRIAIYRYARYGAYDASKVDALMVLLTEYRENAQAIVLDVGFRKDHNDNPRIFDYYQRALAAMGEGTPPLFYRDPNPNPEPEPLPPDPIPEDPMKQPINQDLYEDAIAASVSRHTGLSHTNTRQGVREGGDRHERLFAQGLPWCALSLAQAVFNRDGSDAVQVPHATLDKIANDCAAIDKEWLR
jgi:hypothetical protein